MKTESLARYLRTRSKEICAQNECAEEKHNCESYAYINGHMQLLDICASDYFQGHSKAHAAIPLPWTGTQKELQEEVMEQCFAEISDEGHVAYCDGKTYRECPYKGEAGKWWRDGWREGKQESFTQIANPNTR